MQSNRIGAEHTAKVLLINLEDYCNEKGKAVSRFRMSRDSLKRASNRKTLRESFVIDVIDAMAQLGWSTVDPGTMDSDNELAFIRTSMIDGWTRIGVLRIRSLVRTKGSLDAVHDVIDEEFEKYFPEPEDCFVDLSQ
jgi:hypothetical protein